jgi:hypothetical protein
MPAATSVPLSRLKWVVSTSPDESFLEKGETRRDDCRREDHVESGVFSEGRTFPNHRNADGGACEADGRMGAGKRRAFVRLLQGIRRRRGAVPPGGLAFSGRDCASVRRVPEPSETHIPHFCLAKLAQFREGIKQLRKARKLRVDNRILMQEEKHLIHAQDKHKEVQHQQERFDEQQVEYLKPPFVRITARN